MIDSWMRVAGARSTSDGFGGHEPTASLGSLRLGLGFVDPKRWRFWKKRKAAGPSLGPWHPEKRSPRMVGAVVSGLSSALHWASLSPRNVSGLLAVTARD